MAVGRWTKTFALGGMFIIKLAQSSYIEVKQIFGYLAPINHFSVKNVKQLCNKSHWFPKGKSGLW